MTTTSSIFKFTQRASAFRFAQTARGMMIVMLGDDEKFWVVTAKDAARLAKTGYDYAE